MGSLPAIHAAWAHNPAFGEGWETLGIGLVVRAFFRRSGEVGGLEVEGSDVDDGQVVMCAEGLPAVNYAETCCFDSNNMFDLRPGTAVFTKNLETLLRRLKDSGSGHILVCCHQGAHRSSDSSWHCHSPSPTTLPLFPHTHMQPFPSPEP